MNEASSKLLWKWSAAFLLFVYVGQAVIFFSDLVRTSAPWNELAFLAFLALMRSSLFAGPTGLVIAIVFVVVQRRKGFVIQGRESGWVLLLLLPTLLGFLSSALMMFTVLM